MRHDLIPPFAEEQILKALNLGAEKHGAFNYKNSESWKSHLSSLKRELRDFSDCKDFDENGLYNIAKVAANAIVLLEMYKQNPKADDRWKDKCSKRLKIGLDIDQVVADFLGHYKQYFGIKDTSPYWDCDFDIYKNLKSVKDNEDFWMNIPKLRSVEFEPVLYCTSRSCCNTEITKKWIQKVGLPTAPVFTVTNKSEKTAILEQHNLDVFVDDCYSTFLDINSSGVCACYLMTTDQNKRYDVGARRLFDLDCFND